jgi:hypothetical protein
MIRDHLDPDLIHPARLAGTDAWAAWGLTRHPAPHHLELAVPATYPAERTEALLQAIGTRLARPVWPSLAPATFVVDGCRLTVHGTPTTTVEISELAWYRPASGRHEPGDAVTADGWPLVDETTATRRRFEAIAADGPSLQDVADIAAWLEHRTKRERGPADTAKLGHILDDLQRDAPTARAGLCTLIDHARATYHQLPRPAVAAAAFQTLTRELDQLERRTANPMRHTGATARA